MKLSEAINATIEYARGYGQVLTERQVEERLLGGKVWKKEEIREELRIKNIEFRIKENKYYEEKMRKAEGLAEVIGGKFRDILFIGVTGSVAAENPAIEDDIDLMVIVKRNRLWINRLKLRWYVFWHHVPHRKYGEEQRQDEFCFNLWIDEQNLNLPKLKRSQKNAVDIVLMKPVWKKDGTYEKFIKANDWVKKWVATGYERKTSNFKFQISKQRQNPPYPPLKKGEYNFGELFILINWVCFWGQWVWMKRRISKELVGLHYAFFHKN